MSQSQGNGTLLASLRGSHALLDSSLPPHPGTLPVWYVPHGPIPSAAELLVWFWLNSLMAFSMERSIFFKMFSATLTFAFPHAS